MHVVGEVGRGNAGGGVHEGEPVEGEQQGEAMDGGGCNDRILQREGGGEPWLRPVGSEVGLQLGGPDALVARGEDRHNGGADRAADGVLHMGHPQTLLIQPNEEVERLLTITTTRK